MGSTVEAQILAKSSLSSRVSLDRPSCMGSGDSEWVSDEWVSATGHLLGGDQVDEPDGLDEWMSPVMLEFSEVIMKASGYLH